MHSTNYFNTLIEIAEDSRATGGETPPVKGGKKTVANLQFELIHAHPYEFTSDEVIFSVFAIRKEIPKAEWAAQRELFFSKGQPCLRASPLAKSYGWGIHSNAEGKIAIFGVESHEYQRLAADESVVKTKAMRSRRA